MLERFAYLRDASDAVVHVLGQSSQILKIYCAPAVIQLQSGNAAGDEEFSIICLDKFPLPVAFQLCRMLLISLQVMPTIWTLQTDLAFKGVSRAVNPSPPTSLPTLTSVVLCTLVSSWVYNHVSSPLPHSLQLTQSRWMSFPSPLSPPLSVLCAWVSHDESACIVHVCT